MNTSPSASNVRAIHGSDTACPKCGSQHVGLIERIWIIPMYFCQRCQHTWEAVITSQLDIHKR
jgi:transposase-like protein